MFVPKSSSTRFRGLELAGTDRDGIEILVEFIIVHILFSRFGLRMILPHSGDLEVNAPDLVRLLMRPVRQIERTLFSV